MSFSIAKNRGQFARAVVAFRNKACVPAFVSALLLVQGCTTLRGRADDALIRGDYRNAVALYKQVLAENPDDAAASSKLARAERGLLDEALAAVDEHRRSGRDVTAAVVAALETKDGIRPTSIDEARRQRLDEAVRFAIASVRARVQDETEDGRALAARRVRTNANALLSRPEAGRAGDEIDADIAAAGARTCAKASETAGNQPFALALVAAYCKDVGGPMPAWKPRPFLVSGVDFRGGGTPEDRAAIAGALERSVWFSPTSQARAVVDVRGAATATFDAKQVELSRPWVEHVPYTAIETYQEAVQVPYLDTETYTDMVPYVARELRTEPCAPPRTGTCTRSVSVTRMRPETKVRTVTKFRTEYRTKTRPVTRVREEARVFRFPATKHEGHYNASFVVRFDLDGALRPVTATYEASDVRVAYEHDAHFPAAGVAPERGVVPSAEAWAGMQRMKLADEVQRSLDAGWVEAFCSEAIASQEDAARCAHARPKPAPKAVRELVASMIGDDPDAVLALPRPREAVF